MEYSKKYRWALAGFVVMLILNILVLGSIWFMRFQSPGAERGRQDSTYRLQRFMERELDLSAEQVRELQALRRNHMQEAAKLRNAIQQDRRTLFKEIQIADSTERQQAIDSLSSQIGETQARLDAAIAAHLSEVRMLCNDEQRLKYDRIVGAVMKRMNRRGR